MVNLGQKLLKKAQKIIPGGNQLLSKRSEMFLPNLWPAYYNYSKGCIISDLNNKKYYDFAGMGVTSCVLGYADTDINKAIIKGLKKGSMSTLNAPEEVDLADRLIKIHKWAEMVRFSKSGGEACLIAIRIARAFTKKEKIAFCGYHGWHDWYMAANLGNSKNLDEQLLPGLGNKGVSKSFKNSIHSFNYNDINSLKKIFKKNKNQIGIVIMEPMRFTEPKNNFLLNVKKLAKKNGAVFIFDEITSGFHENLGGLHLKFKVNPDMAIFGKALGNGYPISAVIGKKKIMNFAQRTFISSTMWTERLGFIAGVTTLDKMKKLNVQKKLIILGKKIKTGWNKAAKKNKIKISISGLDSLPNFRFDYENRKEISTYFTQEMLELGFLAKEALAITYVYNDKIIKKYLKSVDLVFSKINYYQEKKIKLPLKGPLKHSTLKRITY
jgi:glutamate-1-semialdehyde 2,1-aminomutase